MQKKLRCAIIGSGSFGTALAILVSSNGHHVTIYEQNPNIVKNLKQNEFIVKSQNITIAKNIEKSFINNDYIIPSIPSKYLKKFYQQYLPITSTKTAFIGVSKGFFDNNGKTISQSLPDLVKNNRYFVLSGPTFAHEIINQNPTGCILAGNHLKSANNAARLFINQYFQPDTSEEILGTELGGIFKNCYSITLGIVSQNFGMNSLSLTINRIINELSPLYKKLRIKQNSIYSLSFLGDLIATGLNPRSRNFQLGRKLAKTKNKTYEGAENILACLKLSKKNNIKLPLLEKTNKILSSQLESKMILS